MAIKLSETPDEIRFPTPAPGAHTNSMLSWLRVSFSAWLSEAAERQLRIRDGLKGVVEWEAEAGPLTPAERAAGAALLDRLLGPQERRSA